MLVASDSAGVDTGVDKVVAIFNDFGGLEEARWLEICNKRASFGMGADETMLGEVGDLLQGSTAAEDNDGIDGSFGRKEVGDGAEMGGVLFDWIVKLVLLAAEI